MRWTRRWTQYWTMTGAPVLLVLAVVTAACGGNDRTITVFAAASLTDVFEEIAAAFEAEHPDTELRFSFGGSQRLRLQLEQGAAADLFASANRAQVGLAESQGLTRPGVPFAANELVLVAPAGNPADLRGVENIVDGVRLVVAGPSVPAGQLTREVLDRLGLAEAVLAQVVSEEESVRRVLTKVQLGEADAGFVYRTDAIAAGDGVLSFALQSDGLRNDYLIAVTSDASLPQAAQAFVDFLLSAVGQEILEAAGFLTLAQIEAGR